MMRIHYFQHVEFEGLGCIAAWTEQRGHRITATRFFAGEQPPPLQDIDVLVVMGGPMNIYEEDQYPWLTHEKAYLRQAIDTGKKVLGICLGAQLIADVLGGPVTRNAHKEIGWFPITLTKAAQQHPALAHLAPSTTVLHWHGDTFALPPGATLLASSAGCAHQAFAMGNQVVALQFHLELTPQAAHILARECASDFATGPYMQTAEQLIDQPGHFARANQDMFTLLDRWLG
jgi:GMP synthase-like glutamine amidotransferase